MTRQHRFTDRPGEPVGVLNVIYQAEFFSFCCLCRPKPNLSLDHGALATIFKGADGRENGLRHRFVPAQARSTGLSTGVLRMRTKPMSYFLKLTFAIAGACALATTSYANTGDDQPKEHESATTVVSVESQPEMTPQQLQAEKRRLSKISKTATPEQGFDVVEMFSAMETGEVEVTIKARSASDSNILVKNTTDRPLSVQMPATFSAVPVLRQFGGGGLGGGGRGGGGLGGGGLGGGGQGIGGGLGGGNAGGGFGGGGRGGGGLGGGAFNIPPGKVGKIGVKTVCLEHGKKDPKSYIDYKIQPLENLNADPKIAEMMSMLANDEIAQPVAQAAAWHVTDDKSWAELSVMNRVESMNGYFERFFSHNQLLFAQQVVTVSEQRANESAGENSQQESSPGENR